MYADDICIYHKIKSPGFARLTVQYNLNKIGRWASEWRININVEKTKAGVFLKKTKLQLPALKLHGDDIDKVLRCPYIRVILDHRMNWRPDVEVLRWAHGIIAFLSLLLRPLPSKI